jgi:hypothetical protein
METKDFKSNIFDKYGKEVSVGMENTYCLFEKRHKMPKNSGPLFKGFDFNEFQPEQSLNFQAAVSKFANGEELVIYVTGLTPALTWFIKFLTDQGQKGVLHLMHYNTLREIYVKHTIIL